MPNIPCISSTAGNNGQTVSHWWRKKKLIAAWRERSTPIWSPKSRTIGAESIIPPGVGSRPIIIGIVAIAKRRLRNRPWRAGTRRCETPVSFMAVPSTLTNITNAVSVMKRYPVVWLRGLVFHSSTAVTQNRAGVTRRSAARAMEESSIARPSLTFTCSRTTSSASAKAIEINANMFSFYRLPNVLISYVSKAGKILPMITGQCNQKPPVHFFLLTWPYKTVTCTYKSNRFKTYR